LLTIFPPEPISNVAFVPATAASEPSISSASTVLPGVCPVRVNQAWSPCSTVVRVSAILGSVAMGPTGLSTTVNSTLAPRW
jgi:hypothetical protein